MHDYMTNIEQKTITVERNDQAMDVVQKVWINQTNWGNFYRDHYSVTASLWTLICKSRWIPNTCSINTLLISSLIFTYNLT